MIDEPDGQDPTGGDNPFLPDSGDTPAELFEVIPEQLDAISDHLNFETTSPEEFLAPVTANPVQGEVDYAPASAGCAAPGVFGCLMAVVAVAAAALAMIVAMSLLDFGPFSDDVPVEAPPPGEQGSSEADAPPPPEIENLGLPDPAPPAEDPDADADPTTTSAGGSTTTQDLPVLVPLAGTWSFTDGAGTMDCGSVAISFPASPAQQGEMQVLDGGTRLIITSPGRGVIEAVVEDGATADEAKYKGKISAADVSGGDAPEGVEDLEYTATFDSKTHAITGVGGSLNSGGTVCAIDRDGVATRVGG